MKRTYYVLEMHTPMYPANELIVQERRPTDSETAAHAHRCRASSRSEAEQIVRDRLNAERGAALEELAASYR